LGRDHPDVAENLYRLVLYYRAANLESEADGLHKRALEIWGKNLGAESTEFAAKVKDLAYSFDMRRDYASAERLFERVVKIHEKAMGPDHPDLAASLGKLAEVYSHQSR